MPGLAGQPVAGVDWQGLLAELGASEEWARLQQDLEESPGGGVLIAGLMRRALREAAQQAQHTACGAGEPAAAGEGQRAAGMAQAAAAPATQLVAAVQQAAWEKLHSGSWHEVGLVWRDAYSLACLLAAAGAMLWGPSAAAAPQPGQQQGEPQGVVPAAAAAGPAATAEGVRQALRELDMAAIMGGPLFRPAVDAVIQELQALWQRLGLPAAATGKQAPALPTQQQQDAAADSAAAGQEVAAGRPPAAAGLGPGPPAAGARAQEPVPLPPGSMGPRGTPVPLEELPSLETFWREYMHREGGPIPVLIDGAMETWPALERWQDVGYLRSVAGPRTVPVEVGEHYLADQWGQKLMTLQDFIDRHILGGAAGSAGTGVSAAGRAAQSEESGRGHPLAAPGGAGRLEAGQGSEGGSEKGAALGPAPEGTPAGAGAGPGPGAAQQRSYLAQHPLFEQIPQLAADIREPDYCVLGEGELQSVNAWFGPAGTVTPLHTDPHHNLLCQAVGRKYVRLYRPEDTPAMYPYSEGLTTNSSQVDMDAPDPARFPRFAAAPFSDCVLSPGQMLYIPPGWWHYVKSLDTSFSVSFWWK